MDRPNAHPTNFFSQTLRHILQELTVASFVGNDVNLTGRLERTGSLNKTRPPQDSLPSQGNDTCIPGHNPNMLILTGPNYSGKSVFLKQNALIVYMAHIGSFVPAESATLGITDKIITRISTRESVSKAQSAFMNDLQQMAVIMQSATNHSLVIIDEFGKGTDSRGEL